MLASNGPYGQSLKQKPAQFRKRKHKHQIQTIQRNATNTFAINYQMDFGLEAICTIFD